MVITLLKNFAYVGTTGQGWNTDWISFPAEFKNAQLVISCKSLIGGVLAVQLQSTWDTDSALNTGTVANVNAVANSVQDITTGLGPMVRLNLAATGNTQLVLSVWLTPKSD